MLFGNGSTGARFPRPYPEDWTILFPLSDVNLFIFTITRFILAGDYESVTTKEAGDPHTAGLFTKPILVL
jgi:hypothetical protein